MRVQAGVPLRHTPERYGAANGLLLRGVVLTTYVVDDDAHPEVRTNVQGQPVAVYCDVLCYGSHERYHSVVFQKVLVSQDRGGMHDGRVWKPKAATVDITQNGIDINRETNPAYLDGDHVLVGFLDDNLYAPIILRGVPHPSVDPGNTDRDVGHRLNLKVADGDPSFWKHHGSYYGISDVGDFVVDLTRANDGKLAANGTEPNPVEDGSVGNYIVRIPKGSTVQVEIEGGETLLVTEKDGNATLQVGNGAVHAAVAEHLETLYDQAISGIKAVFDSHVHPSGMGPTGQTATPFPNWDGNIVSDKVSFPDT